MFVYNYQRNLLNINFILPMALEILVMLGVAGPVDQEDENKTNNDA